MKKLTIYIARHSHSSKKSGHSEPCHHCTKEIKRIVNSNRVIKLLNYDFKVNDLNI